MPTIRVHDLDLAYEDEGSGPALLFVMGFTASRFQWLGFERRFRATHRVISFDNRGVGETSAPPGPYSIKQMAGDALGLLDALSIERFSVVGVSMGGMIAQELCLLAPSRVDRVVLGCTHAGGRRLVPPGPEVAERFAGIGKRPAGETLRGLIELNLSAAFRAARPEVVDLLIEHGLAHKMNTQGFFGQMTALASHDMDARLPQLAAPTLVLSGDDDRLVPVGNSLAIAASVPGAALEVLPGAGHMFWVERADEAEAAVRSFLAPVEKAG
jgi:3-oxoadipate enol-lactonase